MWMENTLILENSPSRALASLLVDFPPFSLVHSSVLNKGGTRCIARLARLRHPVCNTQSLSHAVKLLPVAAIPYRQLKVT
mmetsp:Transcript_9657/g.28889  ORF Transcript_9657/g.28889 Transcript_9657/m.28889 type:complete len:80 (-) Transcript_9657:78-317(-)